MAYTKQVGAVRKASVQVTLMLDYIEDASGDLVPRAGAKLAAMGTDASGDLALEPIVITIDDYFPEGQMTGYARQLEALLGKFLSKYGLAAV